MFCYAMPAMDFQIYFVQLFVKGGTNVFCRKTGPGSYSEEEMQGATLITIADGTNEVTVEHIYR